jgi:2-polyprenyl-3-methyl-5-hydroxy-6-metoxy-1,4-benzoquinol methylase
MNTTTSVSAEGFALQLSRRALEPEELISGEEAKAYANRRDNRTLSSKLIATDIAEKLLLTPASNVLEVACGPGQLAYELWKVVGCSITATDGSPELIEAATDRYKETSIRFATENLHSHTGKGEYDAVICKDSFHHFFDSEKAVAEMLSLLKPGGKIYIFDLCRNARIEEVEYRLSSIQASHEKMRFLRSLNASLTVQEFEEACGTSKVSVFYPLSFSQENQKVHETEIEADVVKEFKLSSLFSVYVVEKI